MPSFRRIDLEGVDDIYQDPKHGSYYLRIYLDWEEPKKRERFRTLGTRNLRQALERAKELRAEVARLNPEDRRRRYRHIAEECFDVKQRKNTNNRQSTVDQAEPTENIKEIYPAGAFQRVNGLPCPSIDLAKNQYSGAPKSEVFGKGFAL